jgi:glycosyltransferase involved in cell wall biosynthesis
MNWVIVTGEYPPDAGGVSDHTRLVAMELSRRGDQVEIWAPGAMAQEAFDSGIRLHRTPGRFGPSALFRYTWRLLELPENRHFLIQYVPHAFGFKAMNVLFALWLKLLPKSRVLVLFHEVAVSMEKIQPIRHRFLAFTTSVMARLVASAGSRLQVTIPTWIPYLRSMGINKDCSWNPVPTNVVETVSEPDTAEATRLKAGWSTDPDCFVIGHFGTYGKVQRLLLTPALLLCLKRNSDWVFVALGRNGDEFVRDLKADHPEFRERVFGFGHREPNELAKLIEACDVFLQFYPDGVSSRRGTMMALLALGRAVITNSGHLTEDFWMQDSIAIVEPTSDPLHAVLAMERLRKEPALKARLQSLAKSYYQEHFCLRQNVCRLREEFSASSLAESV